jgi:hypothetical protein
MSSSLKVVFVKKTGTLKETMIDPNKLTKMKLQHTYIYRHPKNSLNVKIAVYGNLSGNAGQENKYEFPPPIDKTLFFGDCILVKYTDTILQPTELTTKEWKTIYDHLYGGFEDLTDDLTDDDGEEDEPTDPTIQFTKEGYMKDGMIVDDDFEEPDGDDGSDGDGDGDDSYEPPKKAKKPVIPKTPKATKTPKPPKATKQPKPNKPQKPTAPDSLTCKNELTEEEYID